MWRKKRITPWLYQCRMRIKISHGQTWHSYGVRSVLARNTINIALLRSEEFARASKAYRTVASLTVPVRGVTLCLDTQRQIPYPSFANPRNSLGRFASSLKTQVRTAKDACSLLR